MFVRVSGEMPPPHSSLKAKGRHAGAAGRRRKWFIETFSGSELSRSLQRFMHKVRIIDRDNDRYLEKVVDPETGEVLRDVDEPLSEHQGRGSAKKRRPTTLRQTRCRATSRSTKITPCLILATHSAISGFPNYRFSITDRWRCRTITC